VVDMDELSLLSTDALNNLE